MADEKKYSYPPDAGEISGFGGSYEAGCRAMVIAGLEWWDAHPDADPKFQGYKNVYGVIHESNADAEALSEAVLNAPMIDPDTGRPTTVGAYGATGAMHQAAITHVLNARRLGWAAYLEKMREPDTAAEV